MQNNRKVGSFYEEKACNYLKERGFIILNRNFRLKFGEIDIIGLDNSYLVFVEVKFRKNNSLGYAIEAVTTKKVKQIRKMAMLYLNINKYKSDIDLRFDIVSIDNDKIEWIKNAF